MPITENMKHTIAGKLAAEQNPLALRKSAPKAAGTRIGVLQDWRQGSTSEKTERRHGQVLRDGR